MYLFKYIWDFPNQTIDKIYVFKRKIGHLWPDFDKMTYALETWKLWNTDFRPVVMNSFFKKYIYIKMYHTTIFVTVRKLTFDDLTLTWPMFFDLYLS